MKNDHEISRPREEFSPPRQEFAAPVRKFSPPGKEHLHSGAEFHQTAAPPEPRKKKSINPLMLTAAAVVTSTVVLSSGFSPAEEKAPKYPLPEDLCAYLDELDTALVEQNSDALLSLLTLDSLQYLEHAAVKPYAEQLAPLIDNLQDHHLYHRGQQDGDYQFIQMGFSYDGERIGTEWDYAETDNTYSLSFSEEIDPATGTTVLTHAGVAMFTPSDLHNVEQTFYSYHFNFSTAVNSEDVLYWNMEDYVVQTQKVPGGYDHAVPQEGRRIERNPNYYGTVLEVLEGTFAMERRDTPDTSSLSYIYDSYLHDGTVSLYLRNGDEWVLDQSVVVKDGYTLMTDDMRTERYEQEESPTYYTLHVLLSDGTEYYLESKDVETEEELLYHTFQIY